MERPLPDAPAGAEFQEFLEGERAWNGKKFLRVFFWERAEERRENIPREGVENSGRNFGKKEIWRQSHRIQQILVFLRDWEKSWKNHGKIEASARLVLLPKTKFQP